MAVWIFSFFIGFASDLAADGLAPVKNSRAPEEIVANRGVARSASRGSNLLMFPPNRGRGLLLAVRHNPSSAASFAPVAQTVRVRSS